MLQLYIETNNHRPHIQAILAIHTIKNYSDNIKYLFTSTRCLIDTLFTLTDIANESIVK